MRKIYVFFFLPCAKKSVKNCSHFETSSFLIAPTNFRLVHVFRHLQRMRFGYKKKFKNWPKITQNFALKKKRNFLHFSCDSAIRVPNSFVFKTQKTIIYYPNLMKLCMWVGIGKLIKTFQKNSVLGLLFWVAPPFCEMSQIH